MRSLQDISNLLLAGADKVSINTAAINNPNIVKKSAEHFGSQCIVVAVDVKKKNYTLPRYRQRKSCKGYKFCKFN